MKATVSYILLFFLYSSLMVAQNSEHAISLSLKVKDAQGNKISNKQIRLKNLRSKKQQSGVTDENGILVLNGSTNSKYQVFFGIGNVPLEFFIPNTPYKKVDIPLLYDPINSERIEPSDNELILRLTLTDHYDKPVKSILILEDKTNNIKYNIETDDKGKAETLVLKGQNLFLHLAFAKDYTEISLPNKGKIIFNQQIKLPDMSDNWKLFPVYNKGLINFNFIDLKDNPVKGETFYAVNLTTKKKYEVTTDKNGLGQIHVPLEAQYSLSHSRRKNFKTTSFTKNSNADVFVLDVNYISISETQRKIREEEKAAMLKLRDSLAKASPPEFDYSRFGTNTRQISYIKKQAKYFDEAIETDPKFFERDKKPILAVFQRFKLKWKNKVIVTDVTGSMSPYMTEVMVWHALKKMENEANQYVFFNDGDQKDTKEKVIGETGGIYTIKSNKLDEVFAKLMVAASSGYGGDGPENDLEALLIGQDLKNKISELILVADNFSSARDIKLLEKLNVPVRIVACGGYISQTLNEQYLNIAMKTKGSIHTLKEDIMDLYEKNEGEKVKIQGFTYVLRNGEFLLYKH